MNDLRKKLIRLAHANPQLRPQLLPLLKMGSTAVNPKVLSAYMELSEEMDPRLAKKNLTRFASLVPSALRKWYIDEVGDAIDYDKADLGDFIDEKLNTDNYEMNFDATVTYPDSVSVESQLLLKWPLFLRMLAKLHVEGFSQELFLQFAKPTSPMARILAEFFEDVIADSIHEWEITSREIMWLDELYSEGIYNHVDFNTNRGWRIESPDWSIDPTSVNGRVEIINDRAATKLGILLQTNLFAWGKLISDIGFNIVKD